MTAAITASINLAALRHNLQRVTEAAPGRKVMAVIKANAYGHGMVDIAKVLQAEGVDAFAVARVDEAIILRNAGVSLPIICFEGFSDSSELTACVENDIQVVIHHESQLGLLAELNGQQQLAVWLKIDSGMHRMGIAIEKVQNAWQQLKQCQSVKSVNLMTHLACADDKNSDVTKQQVNLFSQAIEGLSGEVSIANSGGILGWPLSHGDWVRPGIMLYGVSPFVGGVAENDGLKPVMTLSSRLIAVNHYKKGDAIGYGASWQCPEDMSVGVVACGYGDGYPRHAQPGTSVLVNGLRMPLVGRVSMDTICVDLRQQPDARIGDSVTLWGAGLPVEEVAKQAGTIAYELLCGVTQRVKFITVQ